MISTRKLNLFKEESLGIYLAFKIVKNVNVSYNNYCRMFATEENALESLKKKDGLEEVIDATGKDLEIAVLEEASTSDWGI